MFLTSHLPAVQAHFDLHQGDFLFFIESFLYVLVAKMSREIIQANDPHLYTEFIQTCMQPVACS